MATPAHRRDRRHPDGDRTTSDGAGRGLRVAVFGATGNLGTKVVSALHADPAVSSVVGVARRLPDPGFSPETAWVRADIAEDRLEPVVDGADVVVHLAWLIQPSSELVVVMPV